MALKPPPEKQSAIRVINCPALCVAQGFTVKPNVLRTTARCCQSRQGVVLPAPPRHDECLRRMCSISRLLHVHAVRILAANSAVITNFSGLRAGLPCEARHGAIRSIVVPRSLGNAWRVALSALRLSSPSGSGHSRMSAPGPVEALDHAAPRAATSAQPLARNTIAAPKPSSHQCPIEGRASFYRLAADERWEVPPPRLSRAISNSAKSPRPPLIRRASLGVLATFA
ncbi:hypothetical protein SAMN02787076_02024 [Rhizobacter sp. OV335]|nr:hypothetical protein SAMN02787076_02024 [Rhizobacter sp. OV335]